MSTEEFKGDLFAQLVEGGYKPEEAMYMVNKRMESDFEIESLRSKLTLPISIPLRYLPDYSKANKGAVGKALYKIGFDTKNFSHVVDTCCYVWEGKKECGEVIVCNERLDQDWLTKTINDVNVASDAALFFHERELLQVMRENTK